MLKIEGSSVGSQERRQAVLIAPGRPAPKGAPSPDAIRLPSITEESFFRAAVTIDCSKAARLIGYAPQYFFKDGMRLTSAWIDWACER